MEQTTTQPNLSTMGGAQDGPASLKSRWSAARTTLIAAGAGAILLVLVTLGTRFLDLFILGLLYLSAYMLPGIIAILRKHPQRAGIILVTIFAGWTVIGWVATLIWSFITPQPPVIINPYANPQPIPPAAAPQLPAAQNTLQQLQALADLLDRNMLTKEEFEAEKQKILSR
jgi:Superinfection immunity protein/Short C-terminal domain